MLHITLPTTSPTTPVDSFAEFRRDDDRVQHWAAELVRDLVRCSRRTDSADDVAMRVVVQVLEMPLGEQLRLIDDYPDPMAYARLVVGRALVDFDRAERVQQCRGARLFTDTDGTVQPGRTWASGDAPVGHGGESLFDLFATSADPIDDLVDQLDGGALLDMLLDGLDADERWLLTRVDGLGEQIIDLAPEYGVVRETLSKRVSRLRDRVQSNRARMENEGVIASRLTETLPLATAGAAHTGRAQ